MAMDPGSSPWSMCPSFSARGARGRSVTNLLINLLLYLELLFLTHVNFFFQKPCLLR